MSISAWKLNVVSKALEEGIINNGLLDGEDKPLSMFVNLDHFRKLIEDAKRAFPVHVFLHTMAVKSNPVSSFLKEVKSLGIGLECASLGELTIAIEHEFSSDRIVFDSPAKTIKEIKYALEHGVYLNIDNFQELERVKNIIERSPHPFKSKIGIRINPQVGAGSINELSTATDTTKFGIPLFQYHQEIMTAYKNYPWLNGIHVHVGSQGCPLELVSSGIKRIVETARIINQHRAGQIEFLDIGGGLPVNYADEEDRPSFEDYATVLRKNVPELFTGEFKVITEFGRAYNAKSGVTISRVEYTKNSGGRGIAIIHAGVDLFVRTIYAPEKWPLRIDVFDKNGKLKDKIDSDLLWDIAGPCCFSGDIVAHKKRLPAIEQGDYIMVHDTGAYFFSAYCHYNVRQAPPIYGYIENNESKASQFVLFKKGQDVNECTKFFD